MSYNIVPKNQSGPFPPLRPDSPLGFDLKEEKQPWASRQFLLQEEEQRRLASVPFPLPIRLLSQILCLPLLWVNPYLARPRVRRVGEEITKQRVPQRTSGSHVPYPFWGKYWRRLLKTLFISSVQVPGIPQIPQALQDQRGMKSSAPRLYAQRTTLPWWLTSPLSVRKGF